MNIDRSTPRKRSPLSLLIIIALLGSLTAYLIVQLRESAAIYQHVQQELAKSQYSGDLAAVTLEGSDRKITVSSWELFSQGNIWSLVSGSQRLASNFQPDNLVELTVPHGDSDESMKVQARINTKLESLIAAAEQDGFPLMISSAYRSIADQQRLYDEFVREQGSAAAAAYVAPPGASEHHTGLSVDFSTASGACALDSDSCSLSPAAGNWLADNAWRYGFILRYPAGKQPITGISYEPWHYRYVGIPMAEALHESGLTLDEALAQIRPALTTE